MLILTRKLGESITIGDDIKVQIISVKGQQVRIGVVAPNSLAVHREEIFFKIKAENENAAVSSPSNLDNIKLNQKK